MSDFGDVTKIAKKAMEIRKRYYELMDNVETRPIVAQLYADGVSRLMEWNGHLLDTQEDVVRYLSSLPKTKHTIDSLDAQPLPGNNDADLFLMTVSGKVTYDEEHSRTFFQRMIVREVNGKHYIINDYLRWTSETT